MPHIHTSIGQSQGEALVYLAYQHEPWGREWWLRMEKAFDPRLQPIAS